MDDSIAYDDFPTKPDYRGAPSPDYARDTFVVVNPFLTDINLVGQPIVDRSSETGLYVWQHADGRIFIKAVAGDPTQAGKSALFSGSASSSAGIGGLKTGSFEADDVLNQISANQIMFSLNVNSPWEDRFEFNADHYESMCIDLADYAGGLFIGPDKVQVTPPYDIGLLKSCNAYEIPVDGKPEIDRYADKGWFIWRQNGQWRSEFKTAGDSFPYRGSINSTRALTNIIPVSIESNDLINLSGNAISFDLNVAYKWFDGFRFTGDANSEICVNLSESTNANIYIGPDRVQMPDSFDLNTLQSCGSTLQ